MITTPAASLRLRNQRAAELVELLARPETQSALALHDTPMLLLDTDRVRQQYRSLRRALPFVRFHYAVKANNHPAVIDAIADEGGCFDIASEAELAQLEARAISATRIIHTNPIKKPSEIRRAVASGVRTFVVDNPVELAKFVGVEPSVRVLVRLSYRNPRSLVDLSSKFGATAREAGALVEQALAQGTRVAGFSFHVGSQLDDASRFAAAIADTLALMDALEARLPIRFDTLDIGGGLPVSYAETVSSIEAMARVIRPLLEPRASELDIIAEPGRILVADSVTLVTSVVGSSDRGDGHWYFLDEGVYGSYSNVVSEDTHPLIISERELVGPLGPLSPATVAGPTCDSADVIARGMSLPRLEVGDLLFSPTMGAYTAVTACEFNGRPRARVVPLSVPVLAQQPYRLPVSAMGSTA